MHLGYTIYRFALTWRKARRELTMNNRLLLPLVILAGITMCQARAVAADKDPASGPAVIQQLMDKEVVGVPGRELLMLTVEYVPGGASLPHRHDAQVFVYVLQGAVVMQVAGSPAVTLRKGETFYEGPDDVHVVSANASKTNAAKILVFIVKDKGKPVSREAAPEAKP
jgi:quercetin dioxygenase-like cupin family protein